MIFYRTDVLFYMWLNKIFFSFQFNQIMVEYSTRINTQLCKLTPDVDIYYPFLKLTYQMRFENLIKDRLSQANYFKRVFKYMNPYFITNHLLYCNREKGVCMFCSPLSLYRNCRKSKKNDLIFTSLRDSLIFLNVFKKEHTLVQNYQNNSFLYEFIHQTFHHYTRELSEHPHNIFLSGDQIRGGGDNGEKHYYCLEQYKFVTYFKKISIMKSVLICFF